MSDGDEHDTDTLLAILASLLDPPLPEQCALLDALIRANGKVETAVEYLRLKQPGFNPDCVKKRQATGVLDDWFISSTPGGKQSRKKGKVASTSTVRVKAASIPCMHPGASQNATSIKSPTLLKSKIPFTDILRPPPPTSPVLPRLAPLTLSSQAMVEKHTPCTLHPNVLSQELACRLFHHMVDASKEWKHNKWWLFDRIVESSHKTSFYARQVDGVNDDQSWQEAAQYWYNGRAVPPPPVFPPEIEEACQLVEKVVNEALQKRPRYPLEWGGKGIGGQIWKANVAASNCYMGGKEGVGFHSDQLTYLGPFPTIASLSLGTTRIFRLREVISKSEIGARQPQTLNIPVMHNSLIIMHASTQERFKHSIPPQKAVDLFHPSFPSHLDPDVVTGSNCRINITFRFYRPDFRPASIPRCKCNVPCVLRADMKGHRKNDNLDNMRYFWMCYAGAQDEGKGCTFVKVMDCKSEGRGPFIGDHDRGSSHI